MRVSVARRAAKAALLSLVAGFVISVGASVTEPASSLNGYSSIDAGGSTCAIVLGSVKCWGVNGEGQLGNSTTDSTLVPVQVTGLTAGVTAISTGQQFACAIVGGAAKCWGSNTFGELGDGTNTSSSVPVQVMGLTTGVTAISAGNEYACAIVSGAAKCWGANFNGELGIGSSAASNLPVQVMGLTSGVTGISAGTSLTCAVVSAAAKCWGGGILGDGTNNTSMVPVQVSGLTSGVTAVSSDDQGCALVSGAVKCWGRNDFGQLGNNTFVDTLIPVQVSGLTSGVASVSNNSLFSCAITGGGAVVCWGYNLGGTLGNASNTNSGVPVQAVGLTSGATVVSAGNGHSCAIVAGVPKCWGDNRQGSLGNGLLNDGSNVPVDVVGGPNGNPVYQGVDLLSPTSLRVRWSDTASDELGFLVYRVVGSSSTLVPGCSTTTPNLTECVDTGLTPGTYYYYYVYAWNADGSTIPLTYLAARTPSAPPSVPTVSFAVASGPSTVKVGWVDTSNNEIGFRVYRYNANSLTLLSTTAADATSATINNVAVDTSSLQVFVVSAFNTDGETLGDSYVFSLPWILSSGPVAAPTNLAAQSSATAATISWTDVATDESGYLVYRVDGGSAVAVPGCSQTTPNLTSCSDSGLTPGAHYAYYVYAWNAGGVGYPGAGLVVHTPKPLPAPTLTDATGTTSDSITLHWLDNATDETGYNIYEYSAGAFLLVSNTGANIGQAQITGLFPDSTHFYVVAAVRGSELRYSEYAIVATTKQGIAPPA
jgi:hypothetical protein